MTKKYHRFVRIFYQIRATAFAGLFVAIGIQMWGRGYGGLAWVLLALQFLAYPHLLFWRARRASNSHKAEHTNLLLDCLLLGIWISALEFPTWIAFPIFLGALLNNAMNRGWHGAMRALFAFAFGALAWGVVAGFKVSPHTDFAAAAICLIGLSVYVTGLGIIVFHQSLNLRDTREALRQRGDKLAVHANVFENMTEAMMIVGADGTIISVNRAFTTLTGYGEEDVCGRSESEFRTALQPAEFYDDIRDALERQGHWSGTSWCRRKDTKIYQEWRKISAIRDEAGRTTHYVHFFRGHLPIRASGSRVRALKRNERKTQVRKKIRSRFRG